MQYNNYGNKALKLYEILVRTNHRDILPHLMTHDSAQKTNPR